MVAQICISIFILWLGVPALALGQSRVVISEIMYHPVERPAFNADGSPVLDLSKDVHEFIELHNPGPSAANLGEWRLTGGISYLFPANTVLQPGQFLVVAKNPEQLAAVPAYHLSPGSLLGPFSGQLGNDHDTIRLRDNANHVVDEVSYSASFPWAIGADALGAEDDFTGLDSRQHQYRGRSLERVSFTHPSNDPANWLASPLAAGPSPGRANAVRLAAPRPVVISFDVVQQSDAGRLIRANQPVRMDCAFSGTNGLSGVSVEYFVDDIDSTNESRLLVPATRAGQPGEGRFTALLPGQPDRSIVRFRIRADRGVGAEVVSPRADDPFFWHAYFVTPARPSTKPAYDLFVSKASLHTLATNISLSPRRVTAPDPPGFPRASWNATEPAVFVQDGIVRDIRLRHHASRVHRSPGRNSFKWKFPRYARFEGHPNIFVGDKPDFYIAAHGLFELAGLPTARLRHVDLFLNNAAALDRMEQEEMDNVLLDRYHTEQHSLNPAQPREGSGEIYKCVGLLAGERDGPYGPGDATRLPAIPPWWTPLQRYEWTYPLQNHSWKGYKPVQDLVEGLWRARGDSPVAPNPNLRAVRAWLEQNIDLEAAITYLAIRAWAASFDDTTQNYFLWRRVDGKWALLPWDFDFEFADHAVNCSIFLGEVGVTCANRYYPGYRPNYLYDAIFKACRNEFKERLFVLNNTLLHPDSLTALGYGAMLAPGDRITMRRFAETRLPRVNEQLGLGAYHGPRTPANLAPAPGARVSSPALLQASPYAHDTTPRPVHGSTTWIVRASDGAYTSPVARITSTTNLTSISIASDQLTTGKTYFWKCIYTDAAGHPSLASPETAFQVR
jgi:hypothetical protein